MRYPVNYVGISQGYHNKYSIDFGWSRNHGGQNQQILSVDSGVIYRILKQYKGGNVLYIKHDNGYVSEYGHLKDGSIVLKVGQRVKKGQQVANMGNTGASQTGCHLHFSIYKSTSIKDSNKLPCLEYLFIEDNQIVGATTEKKYAPLKYGQLMTCIANKLRVRNKPSLSGKTVGYLYKNNKVKIYDRIGDWYKLMPSADRWSSSKYLKGIQ